MRRAFLGALAALLLALCLPFGQAWAAVTLDATATENAAAADPQEFSHTGGASPEGVLVFIAQDGTPNSNADIVSSVTYGGVAMARVQTNVDNDTEAARVYIYFLGSSVPTGAQTVSIDRTEGTTSVHAVVITLDGSDNLEVVDKDGLDTTGVRQDPQVTLQLTGRTSMTFCVFGSGQATIGTITSLADQTRVHDADFGTFTAYVDRLTTAASADDVIGYTVANDDAAFSAVAISEVVSAAGRVSPMTLLGIGPQ